MEKIEKMLAQGGRPVTSPAGRSTKMKFDVVIDEECAARNAGFVFDESADGEIDHDLYSRLCIERGERWTDGKIDDLWDNCGSLYKGEGGAFYAVVNVYDGGSYKPLAWHRLAKSDNAVVSSYYLIKLLEHDFSGKHYTEIPKDRLDEIDFCDRGWPIVDENGDFVRVGGIDDYPESRGNVQVIVLDNNSDEWMLEYSEDCENPPIPDGMKLSPWQL